GEALPVQVGEQLGRRVGSAVLGVPPSGSRTLRFELEGDITLGAGGWYRLDLLSELGSPASEGRIAVSVPAGWRIVDSPGLSVPDTRRAVGALPSGREPSLWIRVERTPAGRLWDSLLGRG
ncbi:MAG: hypothetical protein ACR2HV_03980, partial [Acidimicrobiales bacterium]